MLFNSFAQVFGREEKLGMKRAAKSTVKHFSAPFRRELYPAHLKDQHPTRWEEYQRLSDDEKEKYFTETDSNPIPFRNTIASHFDISQPLNFHIDKSIVDTIINEMLFAEDADEDEKSGLTKANALEIFTKVPSAMPGMYKVVVSSVEQYKLAIGFISTGVSFRQTVKLFSHTREVIPSSRLGGFNELKCATYVRILAAVNMQMIKDIFSQVWAVSIAFDGATHQGKSYFDIRCRFHAYGDIFNIHVMAVPLTGSHTGAAMYEIVVKLFDVLCPKWKDILIGVSSDGAANMTGRVSGVVTRLQNEAKPGLIRVWCLLHQVDIVMQEAFQKIGAGAWIKILTAAIGHLRRQQTLVGKMGTTCPLLAACRWLSMGNVLTWFCTHRSEIQEHYSGQNPVHDSAPNSEWWIIAYAVRYIVDDVNIVMQRLQGAKILIRQQEQELGQLVTALCQKCRVKGPLSAAVLPNVDPRLCLVQGRFAISFQDTRLVLGDLGSFVKEHIFVLSPDAFGRTASIIAHLVLGVINSLSVLKAPRDSSNGVSATELPPVLPNELVKCRPSEFADNIIAQKERLLCSWSPVKIDRMEMEFNSLQSAYRSIPAFKAVVDSFDSTTPFKEAWMPLGSEYHLLREFCGGLASVFPNTATVESDISILRWEKDDHRKALTDFSLEGVLQCKGERILVEVLKASKKSSQ